MPPYERPAAATRCRVDQLVRGEHVERALHVPEVAFERDDAGHRGAHEVPVAFVLVLGHPVVAFTEAAKVGREHDVAEFRELMRVVVARPALVDPAHERLAWAVPVDRKHRGPGRRVAARVRNQEGTRAPTSSLRCRTRRVRVDSCRSRPTRSFRDRAAREPATRRGPRATAHSCGRATRRTRYRARRAGRDRFRRPRRA